MGIDYKKKYLKYKNKYLEAKKIYGGASDADFSLETLVKEIEEIEGIIKEITSKPLNEKLTTALNECKKCPDPTQKDAKIKDLKAELETLKADSASVSVPAVDAALRNLKVEQINEVLENLSEKQVALLNPTEFGKLNPETLQKMTLSQLTDLTPDLAKAFGAEVLKSMDQETFELVLNKMNLPDRLKKISEIKNSLGGDTAKEAELKNKISNVKDDDNSIIQLFK